MAEGVDYSHAEPDLPCLFNNGKRFVGRYVGTPVSGKNLTKSESDRIRAAGLDIVVFYETTADFMLQGYDRGIRAADEAVSDALKYGYPRGRPIYYALDIDPRSLSSTQWSAVKAFLNGAASVTGRNAVGVYGGHLAIETLVPTWAAYGYQTYAWSAGKVSTKANCLQYKNGVNLCGGQLDLNRNLKADFGQWGFNQEVPLQLDTEDQDFIKDQVQRLGDKLMLGIGNPLFPPATYTNAVTLPKILAAVAGVSLDVNEAELAAALAPLVSQIDPAQLASALVQAGVGQLVVDAIAAELND